MEIPVTFIEQIFVHRSPMKTRKKVNQSTSDSILEVFRGTPVETKAKCGVSENKAGGQRVRKTGTVSDTRQCKTRQSSDHRRIHQNKKLTNQSVEKKISTNSTRLIQQFPQKFCSSEERPVTKSYSFTTTTQTNGSVFDSITASVPIKTTKSSVEFLVPFSTPVKTLTGNSLQDELAINSSNHKRSEDVEHHHVRGKRGPPKFVPNKVKASKSDMLAADMKKPLTLMEQKKLQWAREREELNGLWSPWGRPSDQTSTVPLVISSSYVNKFQTSTLQSECHLPPITNITSPRNGQQGKTTLWTCDVDKEALSLRVARKSSIPICINATTGEVHYSNMSQSLHQPDTFQVNNAILISNNNNMNSTLTSSRSNTTTKYDEIIHGKSIDGKKTSKFSQQSANSIKSTTHGGVLNGWSSFDEEAFTSGYQSEATGFLSNGEECGHNSRNGSGDGPRVGTVLSSNRKKGNSAKSSKDKESVSGQDKNKRVSEQNVFVHNISVEVEGSTEESSTHSFNSSHHTKSHNVTQDIVTNSNQFGKRFPINPPPAAMRSSINVGLEPILADYNEIQKMEKEKWLSELEKQREEQRIRKQMEKEEKRPKWGDKGIGVGHFWEPSTPEDRLPQPSSRDDLNVPTAAPAWLEKGLSRMQSSVSQPSLVDAGNEFQGSASSANLFANQSSVDLRNVVGLSDIEDSGNNNERNFLRGQNSLDPYMTAEKDKKRQAALEHQEAIRKQMEERQLRLKQEKEKRLQEEMIDEEKMRMQRLRELEQLELEARKMGYYHVGKDLDEITYQFHDLADVNDVRKILNPNTQSERLAFNDVHSQRDNSHKSRKREGSARSGRRLSLDDEIVSEPATQSQSSNNMKATNLTSSKSMVNIPQSRQGSFKSEIDDGVTLPTTTEMTGNDDPDDPLVSITRYEGPTEQLCVNDRPLSSLQRSRSLSHHREFGTQTDVESLAPENKSKSKHRSHNCLTKAGHKSKASTGEETETMHKKNEKPRWGATQNKKQYIKQSEKDPLYQQRLKRRMDRIKRIEERLSGLSGRGDTIEGGHQGDTGTESEHSNDRGRHRGRSPPRFRKVHPNNNNNFSNDNGLNDDGVSPRRGPLKATARMQINHGKNQQNGLPKQNLGESSRTSRFDQSEGQCSSRSRKIFPDIPGRTIGPLKPTLNGDYDPFGFIGRQGSSSNSSRFSSPSLESLSSKNVEHHYFKKRDLISDGGVEVDMESRIISSSHSVEIHYEKDESKSTELRLSPSSKTFNSGSKKTVISSETSDEITYKKTVIGPSNVSIQSTDRRNLDQNPTNSHTKRGQVGDGIANHPNNNPKFKNPHPTKAQHFPSSSTQKQEQEGKHKKQTGPRVDDTNFGYDDYDLSLANADYTKDYVKKSVSNTTSKCKQNINQNRPDVHAPIIQNHQNVVQNPILNRLGSPPVPALLKKLQAGIPIEDIGVCDDLLYEIPRAHTAGSTSENGYNSVQSDSSLSHVNAHPPVVSRISRSGGLEIDIDPNYELSSIQIGASQSPEHTNTEDTEEKDDDQFEGDEEEQVDDKSVDRGEQRETVQRNQNESYEDDEEVEEEQLSGTRTAIFAHVQRDQFDLDTIDSISGDPIYPYPMSNTDLDVDPVLSTRLSPDPHISHNYGIAQSRSEDVTSMSSRRKPSSRTCPRTTTVEVLADYRSFNLPDYDYDTIRLIPHVDVGGLDVTAAVHNIHRPGTQDTDLSKREKLISYVINNQDVQAQISARDSELSEKGIIEFNVRLPSQSDVDIDGDSDYYKDPLQTDFQERQRATLNWLYSSDSGSKSNDSLLTHLSYLKKGIQQQQQEWNVNPSDTGDDSLSHHYSSNDMSSEDM